MKVEQSKIFLHKGKKGLNFSPFSSVLQGNMVE